MKIGINGTGLTGRAIIKLLFSEEFSHIKISQINGRSMDIETLRDRLLYSSSQGHSDLRIKVDEKYLIINGEKILYTQKTEPEQIKWKKDICGIIDTSGKFRNNFYFETNPERFFFRNRHLKFVIISSPTKGDIKNFVWVSTPNIEKELKMLIKGNFPFVVGAGSCTTVASVPIIDILNQNFCIKSCFLTTVHAVTRSQEILDGSKGWSALDTQLHTTGATKTVNDVLRKEIPIGGIAYRTSDKSGSFIQVDVVTKKEINKSEILSVFKDNKKYEGFISFSNIKNPPSSYIRGSQSMVEIIPEQIEVIGKNRIIVKGLYDNEEGYACHLLRLVNYIMETIEK